ncbi:MAG: 3-phosphoshikimate 1-carboxyvinyltransferase [Candidatus Xenobia bacterium]
MSAIQVRPLQEPWESRLNVPGDKSISHRALMLAAMSDGPCRLSDLSQGKDVQSTLRCLKQMGITARRDRADLLLTGWGNRWQEPDRVLDCGNSGTSMRLLTGILAGCPGLCVLSGDASLRNRPMGRVLEPLLEMGARVRGRQGNRFAPLVVEGTELQGIYHKLRVASAQVKSCILLAGLKAGGTTVLEEPQQSRDHTERMLSHLGVRITRDENRLHLSPAERIPAFDCRVPGDVSSAAFLVTAAVISPGARVLIDDVGLNPTRTAYLDLLRQMGARITTRVTRTDLGEPVGSIEALGSELVGMQVPESEIPGAIDELPLLAVAASQAKGTTLVRGAAELRVKESDRIHSTVTELRKLGAEVEEFEDGFAVHGPTPLKGATVECHHDHRLEMSLAVAGLVARGKTRIQGTGWAAISFPSFWESFPGPWQEL